MPVLKLRLITRLANGFFFVGLERTKARHKIRVLLKRTLPSLRTLQRHKDIWPKVRQIYWLFATKNGFWIHLWNIPNKEMSLLNENHSIIVTSEDLFQLPRGSIHQETFDSCLMCNKLNKTIGIQQEQHVQQVIPFITSILRYYYMMPLPPIGRRLLYKTWSGIPIETVGMYIYHE
jgi:hypothetical protein